MNNVFATMFNSTLSDFNKVNKCLWQITSKNQRRRIEAETQRGRWWMVNKTFINYRLNQFLRSF